MSDPGSPPIRRFAQLPALAIAAWTTWLGWLGLMLAMTAAGPWHPHFLPATASLGLFLVAWLAVVIGGGWRLARGPDRPRAATWLLLGVAPGLIFAAHGMYGLRLNASRLLVLDAAIRPLVPLGASLMDLEARLRYPRWTEGATVVMIAEPSPIARGQVAAMDEHVRALRARLGGRSGGRKVHWVRGPLLGADGRAVLGIGMGSRAGEAGADGDPLAHVDRHEVAHCVLNDFVPPLTVDPPALLIEGWAEANAGRSRGDVRRQVWSLREDGEERSLRSLVGPGWYHAHAGAVYPQGAILVDHILDAHGPEKFLELYRTCRPATFEADCRRVLGVGLDDLDAACRAEVDRAAPSEPDLGAALAALELGPEVDAAEWASFVVEFLAGAERLNRAHDQARVASEMEWSARHPTEGPARGKVRWTSLRSGPLRAVVVEESGTNEGDAWSTPPGPSRWSAWSATPGRSFRATREALGGPWMLDDYRDATAEAAYSRARAGAERHGPPAPTPELSVLQRVQRPVFAARLSVTELVTSLGPGGRRARLRLEYEAAGEPESPESFECVFDADRGMAALSEVCRFKDGGETRTSYRHDDGDPPLLRSWRLTAVGPGRNDRVVDWTVIDRRLGPIPEDEFAPAALLDGPVVASTSADAPWTDPGTFADWYPAPLAAGVAAALAGTALGLHGRFRRPGACPRSGSAKAA